MNIALIVLLAVVAIILVKGVVLYFFFKPGKAEEKTVDTKATADEDSPPT